MEEYAAAKALLFSACRVGCINIDDKWADNMMKNAPCRLLTYSADGKEASLVAGEYKAFRKGRELYGILRRKARRCEPCHTGKIFGV